MSNLELKRISSKLERSYLRLSDEIYAFVENFKGKEVRWTQGEYKGRKAVITGTTWNRGWRDPDVIEIQVVVKTERLDKQGYLAGTRKPDRVYLDVYEWFEGI